MVAIIRHRRRRRARPKRVQREPQHMKTSLASVTSQTILQAHNFASMVKSVPFEVLKGSTLQLKLFDKKWKTWLWYLSNAILYTYGSFQLYSFPQVILSQGLTTESALHIMYVAMYMIGILYFAVLLRGEGDFVGLVNGLGSLLQWSDGQEWSHNKWSTVPFSVITINYLAVILGCVVPVLTAIFVLTPTQSRYMFSLLPLSWQIRWDVLLLAAIPECFISIWVMSILLVYYCYWCPVVFQKIFWLDDLCMAAENVGTDIDKLQELLKFYRSLRCLNILHNDFSRHFSSGFNVIITAITIAFLYCTLRAYELLPLWFYVTFPSFAMFTIILAVALVPYLAKWEQKSADFVAIASAKLRQLRNRDVHYGAMYKEVRSLQLIKNEISHFSSTTMETSEEIVMQIIDYLLLLFSL